jgi:hypothetical protein
MARAAGEFDFNVARALGQAKSKIVDTIYAHTMASGLASISRNVTERVLGKPAQDEPPATPPQAPPAAVAGLAVLAKRIQELPGLSATRRNNPLRPAKPIQAGRHSA